MGTWPRRTYVQYVEKHAQGRDIVDLQYPYVEAFDADNPRILLSYYSMLFWMDAFNIAFDDQDATFRRILHTYRSGLQDYVGKVREQLKVINGLLTGKALLKELRDTGRWLRILPNWDWLKINSYADVDDFILGEPGGGDIFTWRAAIAKGTPVPLGTAAGGVARNVFGLPVPGYGDGTNALIWFTPDMYDPKHRPRKPGYRPDEVLVHELVHASRIMRGVMNFMPVNKGYDDLEEYIATILANIYLSEKGQTVFAGNHGTSVILRGAAADNFLHNSQNVDVPPTMVIQNFKDYQPDFYRALANLPAWRPKYNWVRQYDQESRALAAQNKKPT
jgi:Effector protein